jgi:hypothetical protein
MSRDWTPREQYYVDKSTSQSRGYSLRNTIESLKLVAADGTETPFYRESDLETLRAYKELGFLFGDSLLRIKKHTASMPEKAASVLKETEEELERIIAADEKNEPLDGFDQSLVRWFYGKLSNSFYYNERNNQELVDILYEKITGKKLEE